MATCLICETTLYYAITVPILEDIPPDEYDIVLRMIAQEFVVIVAASMLCNMDDQMLQACWRHPEKFI
jgi:hypothetical protein